MEWLAIPFSRGSSWPRDQTLLSWVAGRFFTIWATREAPYSIEIKFFKKRWLEWALTHYDRCSCKKGKFGHRHTPGKDHITGRTWPSTSQGETYSADTSISALQPPELWGDTRLVFKWHSLWHLVLAALANYYRSFIHTLHKSGPHGAAPPAPMKVQSTHRWAAHLRSRQASTPQALSCPCTRCWPSDFIST